MLKRVCSSDSRAALIQEIEKHDIISFDIFDTLVMRSVYYNKDVFRLLAQQLDPIWGIDFFAVRTEAECVLSQKTYPYIEDIYAYISQKYPCLQGREQELIEWEIALETELILPRHDVVEIFYLAQKMNKPVYIVSDMYMRQETLAAILKQKGITGYVKLLVSSEYNSSKPQHLFEHYLREIPRGSCLHIGDSWECDIVPTGKLGIDSFRLKMSTEIYERTENTVAPAELQERIRVAEYVAERYNSPFFSEREMNLKALVNQMSVHQKIGQLTQYNANLFVNTSAEITGPMEKLGLTKEDLATVSSVLNFSSVDEVKAIQQAHLKNDPHKIPMVFMMDVIHGYRTIYPIPLGLGCSFDPKLAEECSYMAAKEASADGVQVTFTPMVDYVRDARWGRVMETGGEEPRLTSVMAQAQIRGFQGDNMADPDRLATCVKHYAAYGGAEAGRDYNMVELSERELREFYLPAYKACIDAGAPMLMPSFNSLNGIPSTANPLLMQKILKDEWGFEGMVISDYNAIGELIKHGVAAGEKEAAKLAFDNNCDMEMCSSTYFHHLEELLNEGVFTMEQLDAAVLRVLEFKEKLGLFEDPYHGADKEKAESLFLCDEHRALVRRAAEESAVLLKNDGVLPLSENVNKVAVIGPFAANNAIKGFWSCQGKDEDCVSVYEGISNLLGADKVSTAAGCGNLWGDTDTAGFAEAIELAKNADAVVLCVGEPQNYSGEGNSRADLRLPGMQEELVRQMIAANPNTAVVVFNGRPLDLSAVDAVAPAILTMWFPGTEGGNAAANLLFGKANPSGKLDMTYPRHVGQCPIYYNRTNTGRPKWTSTLQHKGYASDYVDCPTLPLYPFGHGLSYCNFTYSDLKVSSYELEKDGSIQVSVKVKNDSDRSGKEVVQLYMRDPVASVLRPVQQLIAFEKVTFAPGEEKTVTFTVKEADFRFWNFEGKHVSEPGDIRLMVGYADHFLLEDTIRLV